MSIPSICLHFSFKLNFDDQCSVQKPPPRNSTINTLKTIQGQWDFLPLFKLLKVCHKKRQPTAFFTFPKVSFWIASFALEVLRRLGTTLWNVCIRCTGYGDTPEGSWLAQLRGVAAEMLLLGWVDTPASACMQVLNWKGFFCITLGASTKFDLIQFHTTTIPKF